MNTKSKAFTAIVTPEGYTIGLAERDVAGYQPVRDEGPFENYDAARERADKMNVDLGLDPKEAWFIVASSVGAQRKKDDRVWLTVDDIACRWSVSRATPYRLIRTGKLRARNFSAVGHVRARWRVLVEDLDQYEKSLDLKR